MMIAKYQKTVPYPLWRVLSQFFDLEHIEHVHPRTFGRARLVSQHRGGVTWELESPRYLGLRSRSLIVQEYLPPKSYRGPRHQGVPGRDGVFRRLARE
jgi:hypothetical protein